MGFFLKIFGSKQNVGFFLSEIFVALEKGKDHVFTCVSIFVFKKKPKVISMLRKNTHSFEEKKLSRE